MKAYKQIAIILGISIMLLGSMQPVQIFAESNITFTDEEKELISKTQKGEPIRLGILPHNFPLSECPPDSDDYVGTNVEILALITKKTGLKFEFGRVPLDDKSPYQSLVDQDFTIIAGTIRLENFIKNPNLILSDRFDDGSLICISKNSTSPSILKKGKIATLEGYQAGKEFAQKQFPNHEIIYYNSNQDVVSSVRKGDADLAMIGRYVGTYELQSPLNDKLSVIGPFQVEIDSCIMGIRTAQSEVIMSVINKGLSQISENEYNHVQMDFSITHPYVNSIPEYVYQNRYVILSAITAFLLLFILAMKLVLSQKERKTLSRDPLTGAYTEAGFELAIAKVLSKSSENLFITEFDLSNFSTYNELHGKAQGDELLKSIFRTVSHYLNNQDVICRSYADTFKVLSRKDTLEGLVLDIQDAMLVFDRMVDSKMFFNFGIYPIKDASIPIPKMLDYASIARKNIKEKHDCFIGIFNKELYDEHFDELKMIASFTKAIEKKEFKVYYQPKFDAITKRIIGAEALVRWLKDDGTLVMPGQFIELFEKNGLIQRMDFYMLEQVCIFLKQLKVEGREMLPISVNFSRVHLFTGDFIEKIKKVVEHYDIPKQFIEIECTETAMMYDDELAKEILGKLQKEGFDIAMDDFGKGYSSLNALCSMPLNIVKLDGGFLSTTLADERSRADKVIAGTISLVHNLSLKVVAEGVETKEQYTFLRNIGCDYIQGYFFSKPLKEEVFRALLQQLDLSNVLYIS